MNIGQTSIFQPQRLAVNTAGRGAAALAARLTSRPGASILPTRPPIGRAALGSLGLSRFLMRAFLTRVGGRPLRFLRRPAMVFYRRRFAAAFEDSPETMGLARRASSARSALSVAAVVQRQTVFKTQTVTPASQTERSVGIGVKRTPERIAASKAASATRDAGAAASHLAARKPASGGKAERRSGGIFSAAFTNGGAGVAVSAALPNSSAGGLFSISSTNSSTALARSIEARRRSQDVRRLLMSRGAASLASAERSPTLRGMAAQRSAGQKARVASFESRLEIRRAFVAATQARFLKSSQLDRDLGASGGLLSLQRNADERYALLVTARAISAASVLRRQRALNTPFALPIGRERERSFGSVAAASRIARSRAVFSAASGVRAALGVQIAGAVQRARLMRAMQISALSGRISRAFLERSLASAGRMMQMLSSAPSEVIRWRQGLGATSSVAGKRLALGAASGLRRRPSNVDRKMDSESSRPWSTMSVSEIASRREASRGQAAWERGRRSGHPVAVAARSAWRPSRRRESFANAATSLRSRNRFLTNVEWRSADGAWSPLGSMSPYRVPVELEALQGARLNVDLGLARKSETSSARRTDIDNEPEALRANLKRRGGGGVTLDSGLRSRLGRFVGFDPGAARLHLGSVAAEAARRLRAEAFTIGHDVFFAEGRYDPASAKGLSLIAHELTHVRQQTAALAPQVRYWTPQGGDAMEREAQRSAAAVQAEAAEAPPTSRGLPIQREPPPPKPSMEFALPAPAPVAGMPEPSQTATEERGAKPTPNVQQPDARAVADRVYDLMRQEVILGRMRGLQSARR
ncbi:MAG: DUF4157 domain-containing protein [Capsulimonas sp.]|uniref:eCIS core domain-containing protein n=1 Tax=Capsulimonas sp. TaxID=2494211 RepID=UPI003263C847